MTEMTDGDLVEEVFKRLKDRSLRDMAAELPVSRGTLNRWQRGDVTMLPATRRKLLDWLGARPTPDASAYEDGVRYAVERIERTLDELRGVIASAAPETDDLVDTAARAMRARDGAAEGDGPGRRPA